MKKGILLVIFLYIHSMALCQDSLYYRADSLIQSGQSERVIAMLVGKQPIQDPSLLYIMGLAFLHTGQNNKAEELLLKAYESFENENNKYWMADCMAGLGNLYWATGQNYLALQYQLNALDIRKKLENRKKIAASYNDVGLVYSLINPVVARDYYELAMGIYRDIYGPDDERTANSNINMALITSKTGQYEMALQYLDKAYQVKKSIYSESHPSVGFIHSAKAQVYTESGRFDEAIDSYRLAEIIYRTTYGERHPELANIYNRRASLELSRGNYNLALVDIQKAMIANHETFNADNYYLFPADGNYYNPDFFLVSLILKGQALESRYFSKTLKKKDLLKSLELFEFGDKLIDDLRHIRSNQEDKIFLNNQANDLYEHAVGISLELADISIFKKPFREKAFYFSEKSKAIVLLDAINDANAKEYADIPKETIEKENSLKSEIAFISQQLVDRPEEERESELRSRLFSLQQEYDKLIKRLENEYPDYYNLKYEKSIPSVAELQSILPDGTGIQSYFMGKNRKRLYVFQLTSRRFRVLNEPLSPDLQRNLIGFRNAIIYDLPDEFLKTANLLYEELMPREIFNNVSTLVIIPTGRLGVTPFEALVRDYEPGNGYSDAEYLVHSMNISYQFSASLLFQNFKNQELSSNMAALLAPVEFNYSGNSWLTPLEGTLNEVKGINNILKQKNFTTTELLYADASEKKVKTSIVNDYSFIHIASHGIVSEQHPEMSCIYLHQDSPDEDGRLFTGEIYNLRVNANLVALSACQTGMGQIHEGEGIIGLSRALLFAGAKNMLVSLWRVNDESTSHMMRSFYENSVLKEQSFSQSLGNIKRQMSRSEKYNAPYHWASFVLIGK